MQLRRLLFLGYSPVTSKWSSRRKSNNAKKPKTEEDIGGVLQQQQQQPLRCPLCPTTVIDMDALELHIRQGLLMDPTL